MATLALEEIAVPLRSFELRLSLEVGSTVALVGPSGAGKSTVLRAIAGLVRPREGRIASGESVWFDAARKIDLPPERRRVGLVFQDYALFPHLTVRQNVEYAGRNAADEYLDRLSIRHLERAKPGDLSGGERQRVALRARSRAAPTSSSSTSRSRRSTRTPRQACDPSSRSCSVYSDCRRCS